jgi:hypothetical protein
VDSLEILGGYNLISSSWSDWTRFTLHQAFPQQTPKLVLSDGKPVSCHGYIMGRWSTDDLSQQWTAIRLFVVDAEFGLEGEDERYNFLLSPDAFTDMNVRLRK